MSTDKRRTRINLADGQDWAEGADPDGHGASEAPVDREDPASTVTGQPLADEAARRCEELSDQLLRQRAEFDNYRRRATKELIEARARAQADLLSQLLPVLDNLERALDAAEHHDEGKVLGGVRLTKNLFVDLLRGVGVEEIESVGTHFDPQVHDAVLTQPSDQEEGVITALLERGYRQGDRVLRPARVAVSSGPAHNDASGADPRGGTTDPRGAGE